MFQGHLLNWLHTSCGAALGLDTADSHIQNKCGLFCHGHLPEPFLWGVMCTGKNSFSPLHLEVLTVTVDVIYTAHLRQWLYWKYVALYRSLQYKVLKTVIRYYSIYSIFYCPFPSVANLARLSQEIKMELFNYFWKLLPKSHILAVNRKSILLPHTQSKHCRRIAQWRRSRLIIEMLDTFKLH